MHGLPICRFPDPLLKRPTHSVERVDRSVAAFVDQLIATMRSHPRCVGLAAPQVGSPLRIAVMDGSGHSKVSNSHGMLILINPRIVAAEGEWIQREGCLSIPDFTASVRRAERIRLTALDVSGIARTWTLEGFEAVIAQHEVDHLDGTLFLDRLASHRTDVLPRKTYG